MDKKQSELTVVTRAKELCSYIMTVTQKCPKNFRYTYVSRLQNLAMDVIENIFRANDTFVSNRKPVSQNNLCNRDKIQAVSIYLNNSVPSEIL